MIKADNSAPNSKYLARAFPLVLSHTTELLYIFHFVTHDMKNTFEEGYMKKVEFLKKW